MARFLAKNIVHHQLATSCEVQLAYAIGKDQPTSVRVDTFGTSACSEKAIEQWLMQHGFEPLRYYSTIILTDTLYFPTATFGHFGREQHNFSWEKLDHNLFSVYRT